MSLLQMKHICKSFSGVYANEDINLTDQSASFLQQLCPGKRSCPSDSGQCYPELSFYLPGKNAAGPFQCLHR